MANDKVLYERRHIFIKERLSPPDTQAAATPLDEINGIVTIIETGRGKFFRFIPFGVTDSVTDDWALVNNGQSIISFKNRGKNSDAVSMGPNPLLKFCYNFDLNNLRSIRRNHMLDGIAYLVIVLKDGTKLPSFHFKLGGSRELLQFLVKTLPLEK